MPKTDSSAKLRFIDLFCGIGGFHYALSAAALSRGLTPECVFASDIDGPCREAYEANFGVRPNGDITKVKSQDIPNHDVLLAGFPCQPFSIIGQMKGFDDIRGTLFFDIARILDAKKPRAFILENVKLLKGHNGGKTLRRILDTLNELGYKTDYRVLNALNFGLPHKRERIWIVGYRGDMIMEWPAGDVPMRPLSDLLEKKVDKKHDASDYIREKRHSVMQPGKEPTIWHENKAGNISAYPYSCALRAGASYNYLLVDGKRRLTPREMLRLQGFPDEFTIVCSDSQTRKQAGNSLPINVAEAISQQLLTTLGWQSENSSKLNSVQMQLLEGEAKYNEKSKAKNSRKIRTSVSS